MYNQITTPEFMNAQSLVQFHSDITNGKPLRFLEAMRRSLGSLSTEPRDKVFALLGLVFDSGIFIPVPNYRQSLSSVCVSITMSAISSTATLDFVPMLGSGVGNQAGLPTWVANWFDLDKASAQRSIEYLLRSKPKGMNVSAADGFLHSAGAEGPAFSTDGTRLLAKGFIFDSIKNLSHTAEEATFVAVQENELHLSPMPNPHGSDYELAEAISRSWTRHTKSDLLQRRDVLALTLIFDFWMKHPKLEMFDGPVKSWLLSMNSFVLGDTTLRELATRALPTPQELSTDAYTSSSFHPNTGFSWGPFRVSRTQASDIVDRRVGNLDLLLQAVEDTLKDGMRFMVTADGFVGWAHPRAEKHDKICILRGCSVPVIIRAREGGGYYVVGDAYVEGIMKGEAMIGLQEDDWGPIALY